MIWTEDKPTETGFYWMLDMAPDEDSEAIPSLIRVEEMCCCFMFRFVEDTGWKPLSKVRDFMFCGPLRPPSR